MDTTGNAPALPSDDQREPIVIEGVELKPPPSTGRS